MTDEWKSLINETTDEIRSLPALPAEKEIKENKFEKNSAQAKSILDIIIFPALNELKAELDTHHTSAIVASSEKTVSGDPASGEIHYRASVSVNFSGVLGDVANPEFFYEICLRASPYKLSYSNTCRVADTRGSRELRGKGRLPTTFDLTDSSIPELTRDNIKQDFALRYKESVEFLKTLYNVKHL